jgi:hypothetical protein
MLVTNGTVRRRNESFDTISRTEGNTMNPKLKALVAKYGPALRAAGVPPEEASRFLQQIAKMMLHS